MTDELIQVLEHQTEATWRVTARLRQLELIVHAGQERFLGYALAELESASERLSGLELTRTLLLTGIGLPADATADEMIAAIGDETAQAWLRGAVDALRHAADELEAARARSHSAVEEATSRHRLRDEAARALVAS